MYNKLIFCVLIIFSSITASAEIYSWTDEKGVKHYSTIHPGHSDDVKTSDEIEYNAEEDQARAEEYEKWMNRKKQEDEINALRTKRTDNVRRYDENPSDAKAEQNESASRKTTVTRTVTRTVIYVNSQRHHHKHDKNMKTEKSAKVRTESKKEKIKSQKASTSNSSQKNRVRDSKQ